jgi:hypothetical protein
MRRYDSPVTTVPAPSPTNIGPSPGARGRAEPHTERQAGTNAGSSAQFPTKHIGQCGTYIIGTHGQYSMDFSPDSVIKPPIETTDPSLKAM